MNSASASFEGSERIPLVLKQVHLAGANEFDRSGDLQLILVRRLVPSDSVGSVNLTNGSGHCASEPGLRRGQIFVNEAHSFAAEYPHGVNGATGNFPLRSVRRKEHLRERVEETQACVVFRP